VVEGDLPVRTVLEASEAFCCGTGATVTPVGSVHYKPGHDELETETVSTFVEVIFIQSTFSFPIFTEPPPLYRHLSKSCMG